ncbi:MAG: hypothetical protein F4Z50_11445 [Gemmatimonadetes bacterium]|nr:hypothetical protein [Gemmatimonadota bacterium]MYD12587.1 hypothetical protein [Gemmatimonadota bacterium]
MSILLLIAVLILAGGFCGWIYYRREFEVRARGVLLAARLVAVTGVVALLWNPTLPTAPRGAGPERFAILDASASMAAAASAAPSTTTGTTWDEALRRAAALADGGARVLVLDDRVHAADPARLDGLRPVGTASLLAGAVTVAAEAGAREVVLISDRRVRDPVATAAIARRLGVGITVDTLPGAAYNLGIGRLLLPATAERGETVRGRVELGGSTATPPDSATVTISLDGRPIQALRLPVPTPGGTSTAEFTLGGSLAAGPHRVTARIEGADAFPDDDERAAIVEVDPEETGVLLVSFAPDWEPRFLLPVLNQVTGLPVRGFLRTGPDRFQAMDPDGAGATGTAAAAIDAAALERLLSRAEMVVAMGLDGAAAEFIEGPTARTRRLLLFAADAAGAALGGVAAGAALTGEWYPDEAPPSPVAGEVARLAAAGLPPLTGVLPLLDQGGGAALDLRLGGAGEPRAALLLRTGGGRRVGVVLARGFWRWAFRDGVPREHYRALWAAVGGWMMADEPLAAGPGVRPVAPILPRGAAVSWLGRGHEGEEVRITVTDSAAATVLDSAVTVPAGGHFTSGVLPAGRYMYTVAVPNAPAPDSGAFEVESWTDEMLRLPVPFAELTVPAPPANAALQRNRPLRAWPPAYLVILAALCAEWIGRRRAGLR